MTIYNLYTKIDEVFNNSYVPLELDFTFSSDDKEVEENIDSQLKSIKSYILRIIKKKKEKKNGK